MRHSGHLTDEVCVPRNSFLPPNDPAQQPRHRRAEPGKEPVMPRSVAHDGDFHFETFTSPAGSGMISLRLSSKWTLWLRFKPLNDGVSVGLLFGSGLGFKKKDGFLFGASRATCCANPNIKSRTIRFGSKISFCYSDLADLHYLSFHFDSFNIAVYSPSSWDSLGCSRFSAWFDALIDDRGTLADELLDPRAYINRHSYPSDLAER